MTIDFTAEQTFTMRGGQTLHAQTTMYPQERGWRCLELLGSLLGESIGNMVGMLDSIEGAQNPASLASVQGFTSTVMEQSGALDGEAFGKAIGGLFERAGRMGSLFGLFKTFLSDTKISTDGSTYRSIDWATDFRGDYTVVTRLVVWVLVFNFKDYFFGLGAHLLSEEK